MKPLPKMDVDLGFLFDTIGGRIKSRLLLAAIELKLFDLLTSEQSHGDIARTLGSHPGNTGLFLDSLAASGLVEKKNGLYHNSDAAAAALVTTSPAYMGEMIQMMNSMSVGDSSELRSLVLDGPPSTRTDSGSQETWTAYARSMANYQRGGIAQKMAEIVSGTKGFSSFGKMLDLGGGPGLYCLAMVAEHPSMTGVVFDQPPVAEVAREFIQAYGMEERVTVMGGDFANDPIGEGYDLIWASATLNFVRKDLNAMVEKIYNALAPGGVFISFADGLTHERTQPSIYVLTNLINVLKGEDLMFDKGEIARAMETAGFREIESTTVETPMMPMELDIARKPRS
ncbi:MAG: methyltransferase domain-containing protein [Desulfobacteraceae bacterium]|nr:methyltransferase domain-containing protein [Desulfobacteraceae bacterium]